MKELFEQVLIHLPEYISNFFQLFTTPKTFILTKVNQFDQARTETLGEALSFAAISYALIAILRAASSGDEFLQALGKGLVSNLLFLIMTASVLRLSWRIVGGKASFEKLLVASCYFLGVSIVLSNFFILLSTGIFKSFDFALYQKLTAFNIEDMAAFILFAKELGNSPAVIASALVDIVGTVIVSGWSFIGWGAYRQVNNVSKWKSAVAFLITGLLNLLVWFVASLINNALMK